MLLNLIVLGTLTILLVASVDALRHSRGRPRLRGVLLAVGLALGSLLGIWAVLI